MKKTIVMLILTMIINTVVLCQEKTILTVNSEINYNTKTKKYDNVKLRNKEYVVELYASEEFYTIRFLHQFDGGTMVNDMIVTDINISENDTIVSSVVAVGVFGNLIRYEWKGKEFVLYSDYRDLPYDDKDWVWSTIIYGNKEQKLEAIK